MALAIFIPVLIISLLLGGAYIYLTRWDIQPGWESPTGTWPGLAQHRCALSGRIPQEWVWGPSTKVCSRLPGGQGEPGCGDMGGQGWLCFALGSCYAAQ